MKDLCATVDGARFMDRLEALGQIGRQPETGGITRLAFSEYERRAKRLVAGWLEEIGATVVEDAVGNMIGRVEGEENQAPAILIGSHLDTVVDGGMFDGVLGVVAGVEALTAMKERGIRTRHPIEVIAFTDEEGARFGAGMLGSRAFVGIISRKELEHADAEGWTIAEAMRAYGLDPERLESARRAPASIRAYLELHIEQGKVLENEGLPVGVVTAIAGPLWLHVKVQGEAGHAGTTPMRLRRDPLMAAAAMIAFLDAEARRRDEVVATVGKIEALPGGVNVIPHTVEFTVDLRAIDEAVRDAVEQTLRQEMETIAAKRGVSVSIREGHRLKPVTLDPAVSRVIRQAVDSLGIRPFHLPSGAGHDAMQLAQFVPTGMIFVRSRGGISHRPDEWSDPEDCRLGAEVLLRSVLWLDRPGL